MSRKFISFLGANPYKPCIYKLGDEQSEVVYYVQEALAEILCRNWSASDQICIFLTDDARDKNWEIGLKKKLEQRKLACQIKPVDKFKEGFGEQQIQDNFELVFKELEPGDEVWLDITNAFRSIPIFALVLLNYAQFLKGIQIKAIYYGAFESLGVPAHQIDAVIPDPRDRKVPVINLKKLVDLQQWTNAANDFLKHGNALELAKLSRDQGHEDFAASLDAITGAFSVVRGKELVQGDLFSNFYKALQNLQAKSPELEAILGKVKDAFSAFQSNDILNGFRAAQWCHQHQLYQQGITILRETIVTLICRQASLPEDDFHKGRRYIEQAFNCFGRNQSDWEIDSKNIHLVEKIINTTELQNYAGIYQNLSHQYRNDINHGGFLKSARAAKDFEQALKNYLQQTEQLLMPN